MDGKVNIMIWPTVIPLIINITYAYMRIPNKSWPDFQAINTFLCFLLRHLFGCEVSSPTLFLLGKHAHTHTPSMVVFSPPTPPCFKAWTNIKENPRISSRWRNGTVLERPLQWKSQISKRRYSRVALASASPSPNQGLTLGGRLAFCPSTGLSTLPPLEGTMAPGCRVFKVCWRIWTVFYYYYYYYYLSWLIFVKRFTRPLQEHRLAIVNELNKSCSSQLLDISWHMYRSRIHFLCHVY